MSGCCDHCLPNCQEIAYPDEHEGPESHSWSDGNCHACQERDRIVEWIQLQEAKGSLTPKRDYLDITEQVLTEVAVAIVNGAHMERP